MLTYNMDTEPRSIWLRTTPGAAALAQPYRCTEAGLFYGRAHFSTARTRKESCLLFFTLSGAGLIEQGDTRVLLGPGQALFLNCRTPQSYCTAPGSSHWHHYWVHLDGPGVASMEPILNAQQRIAAVPFSTLETRNALEQLFACIEDESTAGVLRQSLLLHTLLTGLAAQLLTGSEAASGRALVQRAAEHLRAHYAEPIALDNLAETAHLSKSYFMQLFRQYMGATPYNYLLCCRITRAKELLATTDLAVGEIARRTGFNNEANFSTRFARMAGQSPLRYRHAVRG